MIAENRAWASAPISADARSSRGCRCREAAGVADPQLHASGYDWLGLFMGRLAPHRWTCIGACLELYRRLGVQHEPLRNGSARIQHDPLRPDHAGAIPLGSRLPIARRRAPRRSGTPERRPASVSPARPGAPRPGGQPRRRSEPEQVGLAHVPVAEGGALSCARQASLKRSNSPWSSTREARSSIDRAVHAEPHVRVRLRCSTQVLRLAPAWSVEAPRPPRSPRCLPRRVRGARLVHRLPRRP